MGGRALPPPAQHQAPSTPRTAVDASAATDAVAVSRETPAERAENRACQPAARPHTTAAGVAVEDLARTCLEARRAEATALPVPEAPIRPARTAKRDSIVDGSGEQREQARRRSGERIGGMHGASCTSFDHHMKAKIVGR